MIYVVSYLVALALFLVVDLVWLGIVAKGFYARRMGRLMRDRPNWGAALAFYALFVAGLVYFGISTGLPSDWAMAALNGALFGFFAYLTYDATAYAVIEGFDPFMALADTVWGTVLCGIVSGGTVLIVSAFFGGSPA
jgi:uncharacterized membrane protein